MIKFGDIFKNKKKDIDQKAEDIKTNANLITKFMEKCNLAGIPVNKVEVSFPFTTVKLGENGDKIVKFEFKNGKLDKVSDINEENTTGGTASFTPGNGENYATPFAFDKNKKADGASPKVYNMLGYHKVKQPKSKLYDIEKWK